MDLETFIELAKKYSNLGWAIQDQLHSVLDNMDSLPDQNNNALVIITKFLADCEEAGIDTGERTADIVTYLREQEGLAV